MSGAFATDPETKCLDCKSFIDQRWEGFKYAKCLNPDCEIWQKMQKVATPHVEKDRDLE